MAQRGLPGLQSRVCSSPRGRRRSRPAESKAPASRRLGARRGRRGAAQATPGPRGRTGRIPSRPQRPAGRGLPLCPHTALCARPKGPELGGAAPGLGSSQPNPNPASHSLAHTGSRAEKCTQWNLATDPSDVGLLSARPAAPHRASCCCPSASRHQFCTMRAVRG